MDYEKKYRKALEIIKGCLDTLSEIYKAGTDVVNIQSIKNCFYRAFPELEKSDDERKPNGCIVLEDFNGGEGFYKVHLDYLNEKQVKDIETLVSKWNPTESNPYKSYEKSNS